MSAQVKSVYEDPTKAQLAEKEERRTLSLIVDNEFGVLARVVGLFSGRGYNIESLTVSEVEHQSHVSRITVVTKGKPHVIEQIINLLERIVPVYVVQDLTASGPHIEREVALVKVVGKGEKRIKAQKTADRFGARTIDSTDHSYIFELSYTPEKIDKFIALLKPLGLIEVTRSGVTAIALGGEGTELKHIKD